MNYLYFKSPKGNFGDDLNPWLWNKIWGDISSIDGDSYFLGIGSIIHNGNHALKSIAQHKKVVFGTGFRPASDYSKFQIDSSWDIRFLRGPLSARALKSENYISDAAYAIRHINEFLEYENAEKKYAVSLMPYFHSVEYFDWPKICEMLGYHYISPHSEHGVDFTLREIAASKYLITEAMHGAILADALRVPWHRFILSSPHTEGARVSEFKWNDWQESVSIDCDELSFIPFYERRDPFYRWVKKLSLKRLSIEMLSKDKIQNEILSKLDKCKRFYLSDDSILASVDEKMADQIRLFRNQLVR